MRRKEALLIFLVVLTLSCGAAEEEPSEPGSGICLPEEPMTITNSSEYSINHLYVHDTVDYFTDASKVEIGTNMATGTDVTIPVLYGDSHYFTIVRYIFSTSTIEIAITTAYPVEIEECYTYTLHLLEEEFSIEKEGNFAK